MQLASFLCRIREDEIFCVDMRKQLNKAAIFLIFAKECVEFEVDLIGRKR